MITSYRVFFEGEDRSYKWTTVRAERYKLRNGTARFYIGKREVAYFYDVRVVMEVAE